MLEVVRDRDRWMDGPWLDGRVVVVALLHVGVRQKLLSVGFAECFVRGVVAVVFESYLQLKARVRKTLAKRSNDMPASLKV